MTKLRPGDTVIFKATVTRVADYDGGQQIMAKILPNGEEIGWCLPKENAFYPDELRLEVGDRVRHRTDNADTYEVMGLFPDKQVAIRKVGNWPIQMTTLNHLMRL